jgi:hypothetical protein
LRQGRLNPEYQLNSGYSSVEWPLSAIKSVVFRALQMLRMRSLHALAQIHQDLVGRVNADQTQARKLQVNDHYTVKDMIAAKATVCSH